MNVVDEFSPTEPMPYKTDGGDWKRGDMIDGCRGCRVKIKLGRWRILQKARERQACYSWDIYIGRRSWVGVYCTLVRLFVRVISRHGELIVTLSVPAISQKGGKICVDDNSDPKNYFEVTNQITKIFI